MYRQHTSDPHFAANAALLYMSAGGDDFEIAVEHAPGRPAFIVRSIGNPDSRVAHAPGQRAVLITPQERRSPVTAVIGVKTHDRSGRRRPRLKPSHTLHVNLRGNTPDRWWAQAALIATFANRLWECLQSTVAAAGAKKRRRA